MTELKMKLKPGLVKRGLAVALAIVLGVSMIPDTFASASGKNVEASTRGESNTDPSGKTDPNPSGKTDPNPSGKTDPNPTNNDDNNTNTNTSDTNKPGTTQTTTTETPKNVAVTGVVVTYDGANVKGTVTIKKGTKYKFKAEITPDNATDKTVTWSTSNDKIATVTADGVVKGKKAGKATITAKAGDKTASFKVKVQTKKVTLKNVKMSKKKIKLKKGETAELTATKNPVTASGKIKWSTSNKKVVTVKNGKLKAKKPGKATITAKVGNKKATCKVTVKK